MKKFLNIGLKVALLVALIIPAIAIQFLVDTPFVIQLQTYVQNYWWLYVSAIFFLKMISIIYPPLPGAAFTVSAIPFVGWQVAYIVDVLAGLTGASVAYVLGSKYGRSLLLWSIGEKMTHKIESIQLKKKNQIETFVMLRTASGGILSDGLAWGASLIGFSYSAFAIGYVVSHLITTMPIFYLLSTSVSVDSWIIAFSLAVLAWIGIYTFKGRYFE